MDKKFIVHSVTFWTADAPDETKTWYAANEDAIICMMDRMHTLKPIDWYECKVYVIGTMYYDVLAAYVLEL